MLLDKEIIINADEWSFDRALKQKYSWLSKRKSCPIINILYKRKANMIQGTTSNGEWFSMIHANTGDSIKFWIFLKLFERCWLEASEDNRSLPCIVVNNAFIHTSKLTKAIYKNIEVRLRFMPPYWPEVAPVEQMFKMLKAKIRAANVTREINFWSITAMKTIAKGLTELSEETWRRA